MHRSIRTLTLAIAAAGLLAGASVAARAQQPRTMQQSVGQAPKADASKAQVSKGGNGGENCGTPDEPKPCPPLPRVNLERFPANRTE